MSRGIVADPALDWVIAGMPHAPPMRFLDGVVEVAGPRIVCTADIGPDHLLLEDDDVGGVSGLVAIELFAQAAAALLVHHAGRDGRGATSGYLLGARKLVVTVPRLGIGDRLVVHAEESFSQGPIAQFAGRLDRDGVEIARGAINVVHGVGAPDASTP